MPHPPLPHPPPLHLPPPYWFAMAETCVCRLATITCSVAICAAMCMFICISAAFASTSCWTSVHLHHLCQCVQCQCCLCLDPKSFLRLWHPKHVVDGHTTTATACCHGDTAKFPVHLVELCLEVCPGVLGIIKTAPFLEVVIEEAGVGQE